jgi:hypothetical protein
MKIYFEDDEKAFLRLCHIIGKVLEENEKFNNQKKAYS